MSSIKFEKAEKNARLRGIEQEKVLTEDEIRFANELQAKANARGMKLVPEKKQKIRLGLFKSFRKIGVISNLNNI